VAWFSHDQIPEAFKTLWKHKIAFEQEKTYIRKVFFLVFYYQKGLIISLIVSPFIYE
jgi:hypothetical protein